MKILIIDDNPADRELAIRALNQEFAGAEFVEIGRRPEFSAALDQGGFDAVLSDYRLHWIDGLHVLQEINARFPYVPVVFMTESGSEEIAVEAMKAGLSDYVLKQHPQRLNIALRESLEKSRLRQGYDRTVAELRQAHAELGAAAEELERRVEARTAELSHREAELAQANQMLRQQEQALRQEMAERRYVEEERENLLAENLRQRELLEHLIASAPVGIAVVSGPEYAYAFANPAYVAVLGLSHEPVIDGRPFAEVSPDLAGLVPELLEPACDGGQVVSLLEFERTAGAEHDAQAYWDLDTVPLHDAEGAVADVLLLVNDVTQKVLARLQAEELAIQLAAEHRFLDSIMDNVPVAITYLDEDLIYRQCNQAAAREFGLPIEQVLGRHLREIVPGNPQVWEAMEGVLRTGEPYPLPMITVRWQSRSDAAERHYMVAYLPDRDEAGRVRGVFAEGQDVTEAVMMRRELERGKAELESRVQERTAALAVANDILSQQARRLQLLHQIDQSILAAETPAAIATAAMRALVETTAALGAMVILFDCTSTNAELVAAYGVGSETLPDTLPLAGFWPLQENLAGRPGIVEDVAMQPDDDPMKAPVLAAGVRCFASIPLVIAGQVIGATLMGYARPGPLPEAVVGFARQVADQLAVAIHQSRLFAEVKRNRQQLRLLSHHLVALQEDERKSLSRELHDRSGQSMTALKLGLGQLGRVAENAELLRERVQDLLQTADSVMTDLHDLAVSLRPLALDRYGLAPAIEQYLTTFRNRNQVEVGFVATGLGAERLPDDIETAIYRIVQESLTNVTRHARATSVGIILSRRDDQVALIVEDDGRGFDVEEALHSERLGLLGMRERAEMLGGSLEIESRPGAGATVCVQLPVRQDVRER